MASTKLGKRTWAKYAILAYLLLLLLSHLARLTQHDAGPLQEGQNTFSAQVLNAQGQTRKRNIQLAYRDINNTGQPFPPALVLLHGSPMASQSFDRLIPQLSPHYRLIIPDLPGFGSSSRTIPDYSTRAHAQYTLALLDHLDISHAHWLGYSQGSGVMIEVMDIAPERIFSSTMLAGIGAMELELLGSYPLNQGLYQLQYIGLWLIQEGLPHFGLMDKALINKYYARNFADTDMRPYRAILERYKGPMLIIQGEDDMLVPLAAAREHARIVPQSTLLVHAGGHIAALRQPELATAPLITFINDAEAGKAIIKANASKDRKTAAAQPFNPRTLPPATGSSLLIMGSLLHFATWMSEDITCIIAGILVANGSIDFFWATFACYLGILTGDIGLFLIGRIGGHPLLKRAPLRWLISEKAVCDAEALFNRQGIAIVFISRFMPGIRMPVYVAAGALKMSIFKFTFYFVLAAALWTPALVALAWLVGEPILNYWEVFADYALLVVASSIIFFVTLVHIILPLFNHRGRRLLLGRWRRWTRWEYWPMHILYAPVIIQILRLALKHRSLTLFTACNPGIPDSGFIGESKSAILRALGGDAYWINTDQGQGERKGHRTQQAPNFANGWIARWELIPYSQDNWVRKARFHAFITHRRIKFPLILKPDEGQRGLGVTIAHNIDEAFTYLDNMVSAVIVQEYVKGQEYGIFYYRFPNQKKGQILGITEKRMLHVTGDGKHTLEQLILDDDRAVNMAPRFLHRLRLRLSEIPAEGEQVAVTRIGTHARGALFLDGAHLETETLRQNLDLLSSNFKGYYFGRYDVIAENQEALQGGKFKVIELNGVTSESTDIYDPKHPVTHAWKKLSTQWEIAYAIAAQNRDAGHHPTPLLQLIRKALASNQRQQVILNLED